MKEQNANFSAGELNIGSLGGLWDIAHAQMVSQMPSEPLNYSPQV